MHSLGNPEADLMVCLAREQHIESIISRINTFLTKRLDLGRFMHVCGLESTGVMALNALTTYNGLCNSTEDSFVRSAVEGFTRDLVPRWERRLWRMKRTMTLVRRVLAQTRARFAFIRGISLADQYYLAPSIRECADVDLVIPEADRAEVEATLLSAGFRLHPCSALHRARVELVGQTELHCPPFRTVLDVNYRLTGNGALEVVAQDPERLWKRAQPVLKNEWRLSDEDVLLEVIRHVGQGHDWEKGLIRACADVAAILRTSGRTMDWDCFIREAIDCECARVTCFFAHFFDHYYRDESMIPLGPLIAPLRTYSSEFERRIFARMVQVPLIVRTSQRSVAIGVLDGNCRAASRFWMTDKLRRFLRLCVRIVWPTRHQLVMLTIDMKTESYLKRRLRFYLIPLLPALPGLAVGIVARLTVEVVFFVQGIKAFFARKGTNDLKADAN